MKKFNQMTEAQMSKTNGGFAILTAVLVAAGLSTVAIPVAASK